MGKKGMTTVIPLLLKIEPKSTVLRRRHKHHQSNVEAAVKVVQRTFTARGLFATHHHFFQQPPSHWKQQQHQKCPHVCAHPPGAGFGLCTAVRGDSGDFLLTLRCSPPYTYYVHNPLCSCACSSFPQSHTTYTSQ